MPPLCTAGYGLATGQWSFFFVAFYLYCINCVFIGIAAFLIIKYLRYSPKIQVDAKKAKQVKIIISVLIAVMILPSSYLAYSLYKQQKFSKSADSFIENEFAQKGFTVIYKKIDFNASPKKVELAFLSKYFEKSDFVQLDSLINANQDLKGIKLVIRQDNANKLNVLKGNILNQIKNSERNLNSKDIKILQLQKELNAANFDNRQLLNESRILFPMITSLSVAKHIMANQEDKNTTFMAVIYTSETNLTTLDKEKLKNWLNKRLAVTNIEIFKKDQ